MKAGSIPVPCSSSGIPLTAALPAPKGRKASPDGEFLRFQPRSTSLGSRLSFSRNSGKASLFCYSVFSAILLFWVFGWFAFGLLDVPVAGCAVVLFEGYSAFWLTGEGCPNLGYNARRR